MSTLVFQAISSGQINLVGADTAAAINVTVPALSGTLASLASVANNGVTYINSSGQPTSSSAFVFNGTNVGIGTSTPTGKLEVSSANNIIYSTGTGGFGAFYARGSGTNNSYIFMGNATSGEQGRITVEDGGGITFSNTISATERMRITSAGNVGIGTNVPQGIIDVIGGGSAAQRNYAYIRGGNVAIQNPVSGLATGIAIGSNFSNGNSETNIIWGQTIGSSQYLSFSKWNGTTVTEQMRIASTGIVTMSAYGAGAATFSASGVISSVSDATWKIADGVPTDPDSMLKKLEPGYWYYNDEKKEIFGTDRQLGFYAQNVNAAIGPEAAPQPEEGKPWGYYDRSVLAVVVMSLQKALDTIESLTTRLTALEQK